jgi:sigma-E factor negative regulatory protein RseB
MNLIAPWPLAAALLIVAASVSAEDDGHRWLERMASAVDAHSYQGNFVYRHGDQIEAMHIVHEAARGTTRERLVSLNGAAREVIRTDRDVVCYLPDKNSVVVEHRKTSEKSFPALLPDSVRSLEPHYRVRVGGEDRIADRKARMVVIEPQDRFRYGYQLWADAETGLLLKSNLIEQSGQVIEQFMFTSIRIGGAIPAAELAPRYSGKGMKWHREKEQGATVSSMGEWEVSRLPAGFRLTEQLRRRNPMRDQEVEHLVFSDGLAAVSVFIEQRDPAAKGKMAGTSAMGAVHAVGTVKNGYQVTAVGEVPADTVSLIAAAVRHK